VVRLPRQGDIWWAETEEKRRPVMVVTRSEAVPVLARLIVAPVTSNVRGIPTEIALGADEGLPRACAASFDNAQPIERSSLTHLLGRLNPARRGELCRALAALADC
jgi:mRNA interferase MazF